MRQDVIRQTKQLGLSDKTLFVYDCCIAGVHTYVHKKNGEIIGLNVVSLDCLFKEMTLDKLLGLNNILLMEMKIYADFSFAPSFN